MPEAAKPQIRDFSESRELVETARRAVSTALPSSEILAKKTGIFGFLVQKEHKPVCAGKREFCWRRRKAYHTAEPGGSEPEPGR